MIKVDVLVEIFQGVINGVRVLPHDKAERVWQAWAEEQGYKDYDEFMEALEGCPDEEFRWYPEVKVEDAPNKESCCECGHSVAGGSGRFVNRVPVFDDYEARVAQGRPFPKCEYVCAECDAKRDEIKDPLISNGRKTEQANVRNKDG